MKKKESNINDNILKDVLNSLPAYIFWKDLNSVFMGCNERFAQIAGLKSSDQIIGKTDMDLPWSKESVEFFVNCDKKIINGEVSELRVTDYFHLSENEVKWVETNKSPLKNQAGEIIGLLGVIYDISERKNLETQLNTTKKKIEHFEKLEKVPESSNGPS